VDFPGIEKKDRCYQLRPWLMILKVISADCSCIIALQTF